MNFQDVQVEALSLREKKMRRIFGTQETQPMKKASKDGKNEDGVKSWKF